MNKQVPIEYAELAKLIYSSNDSDIREQLEKMPGWSCSWGPCESHDQANKAMVAKHEDESGNLLELVVALRGTQFHSEGKARQIIEDLSIRTQVKYPYCTDPKALIAKGTNEALEHIVTLASDGEDIASHLLQMLGKAKEPEKVTIGITGHSLGGCLVTVVAPWLYHALTKKLDSVPSILPCSFAAPTAGNKEFAKFFQNLFPNALRVCNSLDIAPLAFAPEGLAAMENLYSPTIDIPGDIKLLIEYTRKEQLHTDPPPFFYAQPGDATILQGKLMPEKHFAWTNEGLHQHRMVTYIELLNAE